MRRGPQKGSKFCDLMGIIKFLNMFKKTPKNVYQLYHSSLHFDTKKIYRYLRYCIKADLLEIDHIEEAKFLPQILPTHTERKRPHNPLQRLI